jgi:hypothetical protein
MRRNVSVDDRTRAIQSAVRDALREHALLGHPICIWQDGQVVWLSPEETLEELRRTAPETGIGPAQDHHD